MDFGVRIPYTIPGTQIECLMSLITFGEGEDLENGTLEMTGLEFLFAHLWKVDDPGEHLDINDGDERSLSNWQVEQMFADLRERSGVAKKVEENGDTPRRFHGDTEGDGGEAAPDGDSVWSSPESTAAPSGE